MWDHRDPRTRDDRDRDRPDQRRSLPPDPRDIFAQGLDLPRRMEREVVQVDERTYRLRGSEVRTLATIGAFRAVPADDLRDEQGRRPEVWCGDLEHLRRERLVHIVAPLHRSQRTSIVTLTPEGRRLLEHHRVADYPSRQSFHAGVLKPRELSHDAQLYRAYLRSADQLAREGARIERVVLEGELKRAYQRFLQDANRGRSDSDGRPRRTRLEIALWADEKRLPVLDDRVQFPDLRIEYEHPDGRRDVEDVEVMTPHYRGAHAAAKVRSGFTHYRATGGRIGGTTGKSRGRPAKDVRLAEEYLS